MNINNILQQIEQCEDTVAFDELTTEQLVKLYENELYGN